MSSFKLFLRFISRYYFQIPEHLSKNELWRQLRLKTARIRAKKKFIIRFSFLESAIYWKYFPKFPIRTLVHPFFLSCKSITPQLNRFTFTSKYAGQLIV